jgi:chitin disaccharide deacetylase
MSPLTLVACGDDLGLHPATSEGIATAHDEGVLRAASLMVTGAAAEQAVTLAGTRPNLSIGVHLSLLDVRPAGDPAPWADLLDGRGCFPPSADGRALFRVAIRASRRPRAALDEFAAQLRRAAALGIRPTHVDGHNHLHLLPALFPGVVALCADHGIHWVRVPRAPLRRLLWRRWAMDRGGAKGTLIRAFGRGSARALRPPVRCADHVVGLGLHGPAASAANGQALVRWLAPGITEWIVHPVAPSADFRRRFPWGTGWGTERILLQDPSLAQALAQRAVRVAGFGAIG